MFCFEASKKPLVNHYANASERKYFYHNIAAVGTKVAAVLLVAASLGLFATSVVKAMLYEKTVVDMAAIEQKYKTKFNQLSESRIDSATSTTTMQSVVQTVEKIEQSYQARPDALLVRISQHMALYDSIRLNSLDWFISTSKEAGSSMEMVWDDGDSGRNRSRRRVNRAKEMFEIAVVSGEFVDFDGNYRFALSAIDDLEDAMRVSGDYDSVEILRRPLNIEADNRLIGDVSANATRRAGKAEFSIRVVRKVNTDAK